MKQNGYEIVCELFGFGSPKPSKEMMDYCIEMTIKTYPNMVKKYNKEDNADYQLLRDSVWSSAKDIIYRFGKKIGSNINCSFDAYPYGGLILGFLYNKATKRFEHFLYFLIDTDQGRLSAVAFKFSYRGGRLNLPASQYIPSKLSIQGLHLKS